MGRWDWPQSSQQLPEAEVLKSMSAHLSKKDTCKAIVSVLHTNSMIVDTIVAQESVEYVCADIEDFLKMERHHYQLVTSGQI